jgi:hypothetical protein
VILVSSRSRRVPFTLERSRGLYFLSALYYFFYSKRLVLLDGSMVRRDLAVLSAGKSYGAAFGVVFAAEISLYPRRVT